MRLLCSAELLSLGKLTRYLPRRKRSLQTPLSQSWYKKKQQHLSKRQRALLRDLWPKYGVTTHFNTTLNMNELFGAQVDDEIVLDIGFGNGESLVGIVKHSKLDADSPKKFILGCEIHRASLANALEKLHSLNVCNAKVLRGEVFTLLAHHIEPNRIHEACVFFPDPWLQERDAERRMIRGSTLLLLANVMKHNGRLRIATDVPSYAQHCIDTIARFTSPSLQWQQVWYQESSEHRDVEDEHWRPVTYYESKAFNEGRTVFDFEYKLVKHGGLNYK
jgi:tRNA (guanine-N7-)-methyltransferase